MQRAMRAYFAAAKRGAAVFLVAGLISIAASAVLWVSPTRLRGMVAPLAAIGLLQVAAGATVLARTHRRSTRLRGLLAADPARCRREEQERMRRARIWFRIFKAVEMVVLTAGLTLMLLFPRPHPAYAAGLACVLQGSVTLVLDRLAERRAEDYAAALRQDG
jgi:hypothetical protein